MLHAVQQECLFSQPRGSIRGFLVLGSAGAEHAGRASRLSHREGGSVGRGGVSPVRVHPAVLSDDDNKVRVYKAPTSARSAL